MVMEEAQEQVVVVVVVEVEGAGVTSALTRALAPSMSMRDATSVDSKILIGSHSARAHRFSTLRPRSCSGSAGECPMKR